MRDKVSAITAAYNSKDQTATLVSPLLFSILPGHVGDGQAAVLLVELGEKRLSAFTDNHCCQQPASICKKNKSQNHGSRHTGRPKTGIIGNKKQEPCLAISDPNNTPNKDSGRDHGQHRMPLNLSLQQTFFPLKPQIVLLTDFFFCLASCSQNTRKKQTSMP